MHATDQPAPKPSRYRTIRGKNAPESRRFVEPAQQQSQPLQPLHAENTQNTETPQTDTQPSTNLPTSTSSSSNDSSTPKRYPSRYLSRRSAGPRLASVIASASASSTPPLPSSPSPSSPHASPQLSSPPSSHMRHAGAGAVAGAAAAATPTVAPHAPPPLQQQRQQHEQTQFPQSFPSQSQPLQSPLNLVPLPRRDIYDDDTNDSTDHHHQLLEEQKRKDLERLQKELAAATLTPPVDPKRQAKSPSRERFHLFSRRSKAEKTEKVEKAEKIDRVDSPKATLHKPPPLALSKPVAKTLPPLKTALPPMPASTLSASASPSTATARYVVVRCQQFSATISVLPETTVSDALEAAAPLLPAGLVDVPSSILVESYTRLGLERRLRRYERIRDIMNSWDTDADNTFAIMRQEATTTFGALQDLDLHNAPRGKAPPPGFAAVQMHHSQKPGRWSKRYISLVEDSGQLVLSKKETDNEATSLCHLSDYDIYLPTDAQLRVLRAPKTYCFAVKSQQRTTVFVNTENYVHFFSTDDVAVARLFYERVFSWRSWYLARRVSDGADRNERRPSTAVAAARPPTAREERQTEREERPEKSRPPVSMALLKSGLQRTLSRRSATIEAAPAREHARKPTEESLFGGVGNFDPTLDFASRGRQPQPVQPSQTAQPPHIQRERGRSERSDRSFEVEAINNHAGLQSAPLAPSSWFPSASEHSAQQAHQQHQRSRSRPVSQQEDIPLGLQYPQLVQQQQQMNLGRSRSTRSTRRAPSSDPAPPPLPTANMPQPLIDLTPKFQEAPQWSKEGKGHGVRAPKGAHLVDLATDRPRQPNEFAPPLRRDRDAGPGYPPPSRAGRSQTMTSSSQGAAAAAVMRSRSVVHHGRGADGREGRAPPVPLLSRIPSNNAGTEGRH